MHKFFSVAALAAFTMLLCGCGGSSFSGSSSTGGTGGTGTGTVTTISVSNSGSIPADGSASSTITATAANGSGTAMAGVAITFTTSAGTIVTNQGTTDSTGKATATLSLGTAAPGASITVTATSGTVTGNTVVTVAPAKQSVSLQTSSPQIPSDNSAPATITAFVKDANNNFVSGAVVHFQASSGGLAVTTPTGGSPGMTDAAGAATATLSVAGDPSIRAITVTATVGASTASIVVNVAGTSVSIAGPASVVLGSVGTYSVSLTDAAKKAIPSQSVAVTSSLGNTLSASTITTDASGHATFTLTAAKAGTDTVTVTAVGASASESVAVSNQQFQFSAPAAAALIPIAATATCTPNTPVVVNWKSNNAAVTGATVNFSSTRGTIAPTTVTTDGNGNATVMICATSAGPATLSASASGVSATENVSFVSTTPSVINLQASPSTVSITGQSTLSAVVRDAKGNLVQGQAVDFTITDVTGGSLSLATATTDVEGVAQTVYTASNTPSATNGVSITATVHGTAIANTATLTVNGAALHISMGTGAFIRENAAKTAFIMDWFISVLDSSSHPVPNNAVTLSLHSASRPAYGYFKGAWEVCGTTWQQFDGRTTGCSTATTAPIQPLTPKTPCLNEDINLTGVYDAAEDINKDNILEPGDIAVVSPGVVTTASDGTSAFTVTYPEDHALWVQVTLTATATVAGTESSTSTTFVLPILASYVNTVTSSPPGFISPYGVGLCTDPN
jgi:hypothetical protein